VKEVIIKEDIYEGEDMAHFIEKNKKSKSIHLEKGCEEYLRDEILKIKAEQNEQNKNEKNNDYLRNKYFIEDDIRDMDFSVLQEK